MRLVLPVGTLVFLLQSGGFFPTYPLFCAEFIQSNRELSDSIDAARSYVWNSGSVDAAGSCGSHSGICIGIGGQDLRKQGLLCREGTTEKGAILLKKGLFHTNKELNENNCIKSPCPEC
eukprot:scaffold19974_cov71-Attheya_sp.AAC.3